MAMTSSVLNLKGATEHRPILTGHARQILFVGAKISTSFSIPEVFRFCDFSRTEMKYLIR